MGVNVVIGCHDCKQYVWLFRGLESKPIHRFVRSHWRHKLAMTHDQSDEEWQYEYEDVGIWYRLPESEPIAAHNTGTRSDEA